MNEKTLKNIQDDPFVKMLVSLLEQNGYKPIEEAKVKTDNSKPAKTNNSPKTKTGIISYENFKAFVEELSRASDNLDKVFGVLDDCGLIITPDFIGNHSFDIIFSLFAVIFGERPADNLREYVENKKGDIKTIWDSMN